MLPPLALAFNLDAGAMEALQRVCSALNVRSKCVPAEGFTLPLGAMAGIPAAGSAAPMLGRNFDEPMLVLCHFDEARFDALLKALRVSGPRVPLKAVLTPTNAAWNACQLYEELCREREAFQNRVQK